MSYGDVAAAIGSRAARGVGQVMAYYGSDVPWWRVVRAGGHPPLGHDAEPPALPREATPLAIAADGRLRLARHRLTSADRVARADRLAGHRPARGELTRERREDPRTAL